MSIFTKIKDSQFGKFIQDFTYAQIVSVTAPLESANGGKAIVDYDSQTGIGKTLNADHEKIHDATHVGGQAVVKGFTGGAVDMSKVDIIGKNQVKEKEEEVARQNELAAQEAANQQQKYNLLFYSIAAIPFIAIIYLIIKKIRRR